MKSSGTRSEDTGLAFVRVGRVLFAFWLSFVFVSAEVALGDERLPQRS